MRIQDFQRRIEEIYFERDSARGLAGTHMWFCEEVGELTRALRRGQQRELEGEVADVLAWLSTLASIAGVDLEAAARKTDGTGCPRSARLPRRPGGPPRPRPRAAPPRCSPSARRPRRRERPAAPRRSPRARRRRPRPAAATHASRSTGPCRASSRTR